MSAAATAQVGQTICAVGISAPAAFQLDGAVALMDAASGGMDVWNAGTQSAITRIAASGDFVALAGAFAQIDGRAVNNLAVYRAPRASVPRRLTANVVSSTVTLGWDAGVAPPTASFLIEAGSSAGASDVGTFPVGPATRVSGQLPPGTYYTRVRGVGPLGSGPASSEVIITVPAASTAPSAPSGLAAAVAGRIVSLTWSAAAGNATTYVIEAGTASGLADLGTLPTGYLDTTFSTPVPAGTYFVRIRAANAFGASGPSNEVVVVVP
jgi:hypothetical protein